jgi:hypothetical protein
MMKKNNKKIKKNVPGGAQLFSLFLCFFCLFSLLIEHSPPALFFLKSRSTCAKRSAAPPLPPPPALCVCVCVCVCVRVCVCVYSFIHSFGVTAAM